MPTHSHVRLCLLLFGFSSALTLASPIITFEGLPDSTILTNQYSGLTFTNAIVLSSGVSLNEFELPPHSGLNVASDNGGFMTIVFAAPVTTFSGYFTYLEPVTLTAFDTASTRLGQAVSTFNNNLALSGDPGSSPNEFLTLTFANGISSVTIAGDPAGGSFAVDDLTYVPLASSTPEPASMLFVVTGIVAVAAARLRRKS